MSMNKLLNKLALFLIVLSLFLFGLGFYLDNVHMTVYYPKPPKEASTHIDVVKEEIKKEGKVTSRFRIDGTKNIEEENKKLKEKIYSKYGVKVNYGKETDTSPIANTNMFPIVLNDQIKINRALQTIEETLEKYPKNMFRELDKIMPMNITLIASFTRADVTGCTYAKLRQTIIYIAVKDKTDLTLYHEIYHYMENYITSRGASFVTWNRLNTRNYKYGNIDNTLSYSTTGKDKSYFVNNYAQTSPAEDRASTFEYMMEEVIPSCLKKDTPIYYKAKYIAKSLEEFINSVKKEKNRYWERFI